jgi:sulfite exporter TauE/SafE
MTLQIVHSHNAVAGAAQMLAFNITASSLELANSVAINPVESSVQSTGFPDQRVSCPFV